MVIEVKAWWWAGIPNFGDRLTKPILEHFCGIKVEHSPMAEASVVGIGSVLGQLPKDWPGTVIGAGRMFSDRKVRLEQARILAVRGPLSANGVPGSYALGDLGLMACHLIRAQSKKYLGIVPHWSDRELGQRTDWDRWNPLRIDVGDDPIEVVRQIASCGKIVTSSLHALIIADAFGIPRRFEYTPRFDKEGGDFKFRDYSQSIDTPFEVGKLIRANRFGVERVQNELFDVLKEYRALARQSLPMVAGP
jgi:Polysaccharide pyruvyl transferase